jgi:predicted DNA-binding transcriptional regulator YafY
MSINERLYQIDQLLNDRRSVTFKEIQGRLEVSAATLKRDLAYMRDRLHAPIIFDKELGGYRFEIRDLNNQYELPGLWFTADEIYALLTMQHLLTNIDSGGLLSPHIKPLQSRLLAMIDDGSNSIEEVKRRVKIETIGARNFHLDHFQALGSALIGRRRLVIEYHARGTDELSTREISPQRIVYYRDNWYLDAWCHVRNDLRSFSIDAIKRVEILERKANNIDDQLLDLELGSGYGIFAGKDIQWATLRFTPNKARWVATERWHPNQKGTFLQNGSYELEVPFSDTRELIMDILKYGADIEVIEPTSLRHAVAQSLKETLMNYHAD